MTLLTIHADWGTSEPGKETYGATLRLKGGENLDFFFSEVELLNLKKDIDRAIAKKRELEELFGHLRKEH